MALYMRALHPEASRMERHVPMQWRPHGCAKTSEEGAKRLHVVAAAAAGRLALDLASQLDHNSTTTTSSPNNYWGF